MDLNILVFIIKSIIYYKNFISIDRSRLLCFPFYLLVPDPNFIITNSFRSTFRCPRGAFFTIVFISVLLMTILLGLSCPNVCRINWALLLPFKCFRKLSRLHVSETPLHFSASLQLLVLLLDHQHNLFRLQLHRSKRFYFRCLRSPPVLVPSILKS